MTIRKGVWALEDIKLRCFVDELSGCWIWRAGKHGNGEPSLFVPGLQRTTSLGAAIGFLKTGEPPKRGVVWHCVCETKCCANPDHRRKGNRSTQMVAAKIQRTPDWTARLTAARRKVGKLTDEAAAEIRDCGLTLEQIAEKYGISVGYACQVRQGRVRGPLAAPNSSVFAWRPAA